MTPEEQCPLPDFMDHPSTLAALRALQHVSSDVYRAQIVRALPPHARALGRALVSGSTEGLDAQEVEAFDLLRGRSRPRRCLTEDSPSPGGDTPASKCATSDRFLMG